MHARWCPSKVVPRQLPQEWMEGGTFRQGFEEIFKADLGANCGQWLYMVKAVFIHEMFLILELDTITGNNLIDGVIT